MAEALTCLLRDPIVQARSLGEADVAQVALLVGLQAKPLHTLSVPEARMQASAADAARRTVQHDEKMISPLPEATDDARCHPEPGFFKVAGEFGEEAVWSGDERGDRGGQGFQHQRRQDRRLHDPKGIT